MTTQPTNEQLKLALAKLLPEKVIALSKYSDGTNARYLWKVQQFSGPSQEIKETEWLHVCWLIERELSDKEYSYWMEYHRNYEDYCMSWQQRAQTILKVKQFEINV